MQNGTSIMDVPFFILDKQQKTQFFYERKIEFLYLNSAY